MIVLGFVSLAGPPVIEPGHLPQYLLVALGAYLAVMTLMRYWDGPELSGARRRSQAPAARRCLAAS